MKKISKTFLSVLLSVIMVMSVISLTGISVFAGKSGDFDYSVISETDKTCTLYGYTGNEANLEIPSQLNGYKVVKIADLAFLECASLKSVVIPYGVTVIDNAAFEDCASLESVIIPDSVTEIGDAVFYGTALKNVTIPNSVVVIGSQAFGYYWDDDEGRVEIDGFTIYGYNGSAAETYANGNGFNFVSLDSTSNVLMYRLYNPNSGEHFYTADINEKNNLDFLGWDYEGIGWHAPETSSTPVYRLYNEEGGEHHYTIDVNEKNWLISLGWKDEGIGWHSDDAQGVPLYRQYNPNAFANNHNYTTDKAENDWLVGLGWQAEGIGWYGVD